MKKIVSGIMTVAMLAQLGAFNVSAETTPVTDTAVIETANTMQLTDVYASTTGMKLTFSETTTAWDLDYIKSKIHIYDSSANEISYTPIRADKEVALEAELKIGEKYLLKIDSDFTCSNIKIENEIQKNVEIVEKYRMDSVGGTWLDSNLFWNNNYDNGGKDAYKIQDNKIYMRLYKQTTLGLKTDYALNVNNKPGEEATTSERYSIDLDVEAYGDTAYNYGLVVNKVENSGPIYYYANGTNVKDNAFLFGWGTFQQWQGTDVYSALQWEGKVNGDFQRGGGWSFTAFAKHNSTSGVTWNKGETHSATTIQIDGTPEKQTYHIDKVGTCATLYSDKVRLSRYDILTHESTKNYWTENKPIATGNFVIGVQNALDTVDTIAVSNIVLTQAKVSDSVENTITLDDVYSSRKSMKLTFSDELVSSLSDAAIKKNITVSANSSNADYYVAKDKNTLTLNFKNDLTMDTPYTLTIKEGFGLGRNCVKKTVEKHFKVKKVFASDFKNGQVKAKLSHGAGIFKTNNINDKSYLYMKLTEIDRITFNEVKDLENYTVDFGMGMYGSEDCFTDNGDGSKTDNTNPVTFAILLNKVSNETGLWWSEKNGNNNIQYGWAGNPGNKLLKRYYYYKSSDGEFKNTDTSYDLSEKWNKDSEGNVIKADVNSGTLENEQEPVLQDYVIDKVGLSGTLKIDDTIVDSYEFEDYTVGDTTYTPPKTGYLQIGARASTWTAGVLVFSDFTITTFEELDGITIEGLTVLNNENNLTGTITVNNGTNKTTATKVIIAAFDGEEMVTSCVATGNKELHSNDTSTFSYTLSDVGENNTLKVFVWDSLSGMKPLAVNAKVFALTGAEIE